MGNLKKYVFGRSKGVILNTFIGGVASAINTASLLATKLQISTSRITSFSVVGNDIQCKIDGTYAMPNSAFEGLPNTNNNPGITFYNDIENLCISLGSNSFYSNQQQMLITEINFGGVINVGFSSFLGFPSRSFIKKIILPQATTLNGSKVISVLPDLELVYIPRCTILGESVGNNEIFFNSKLNGTAIYANPFLQTNNAGGVDGDLQFAISGGAIVRYVTNFTAPNPITTLSAGAIYNTSIRLIFTVPSGANAIDYYEVYANGVFNNIITASGQYAKGLAINTSYNITLIAVDVFYNKSVVSNSLVVITSNSSSDIASGLVSYYKLDETIGAIALDSYASENLTNTNITINQSGKIGQSYLSTANAQKLETTLGTSITGNFSINTWLYRTANPSNTLGGIIQQGDFSTNNGFGLWLFADNSLSWRINQTFRSVAGTLTIPLNIWTMVSFVYNGVNVKIYINGVLRITTPHTANPLATRKRTFFFNLNNNASFIGKIDETAIYNKELTQSEINTLYNNGNGITL
jgi:hypothetical protein